MQQELKGKWVEALLRLFFFSENQYASDDEECLLGRLFQRTELPP